jgi:hypothetical protein
MVPQPAAPPASVALKLEKVHKSEAWPCAQPPLLSASRFG